MPTSVNPGLHHGLALASQQRAPADQIRVHLVTPTPFFHLNNHEKADSLATLLRKAKGTGFPTVPRNRDHWPLLKTPGFSTGALGFHWYQLEIPAGTKEASTLT